VTSASWKPLLEMPFPALTICPVQDSRWLGISQMIREQDIKNEIFSVFRQMPDSLKNILLGSILNKIKTTTNLFPKFGKNWFSKFRSFAQKSTSVKALVRLYLDRLYNGTSKGGGKLYINISLF
jgi:hypothetical protein